MTIFDEAAYLSAVQSGDFRNLLEPQRRLAETVLANPGLRAGDAAGALAEVTEAASRMLRIARAGVWRFDDSRTRLRCLDLYIQRDGRHMRGSLIRSGDAPRYFAAISKGDLIAAEDAYADPRTSEFGNGYLPANGVGALLDSQVFIGGRVAGVVCLEHVGASRRWLAWERTLACSLADCASLVLAEADYVSARICASLSPT